MTSHNITYNTDEIEAYYSTTRISWDQFYPSEQKIFCTSDFHSGLSVLDIGCGCGGLGLALKERFAISDYTGVDISVQAINTEKI
jgi:methylase of polypeptide subunit release factors